MTETFAKDYFIDTLVDTHTKLRVYQSRPKTMSEVVVVAVELEDFYAAEKKGQLEDPS
ncbi:hypothetical protein HOLleu_15591 [Holothuria leucospilota]|uniref:Uncharacterized protein n=1 Tax=Holothuria leucospilota TaxID=206669 RepID=A0A9Q1C4E5_HOLLE|nr:hypothetical protein HOLleu_15591 [Holothuria leucospilota]